MVQEIEVRQDDDEDLEGEDIDAPWALMTGACVSQAEEYS